MNDNIWVVFTIENQQVSLWRTEGHALTYALDGLNGQTITIRKTGLDWGFYNGNALVKSVINHYVG